MKFIYCLAFLLPVLAVAQTEPTKYWEDKFKQLGRYPRLSQPPFELQVCPMVRYESNSLVG
jgi:hypothetical protein